MQILRKLFRHTQTRLAKRIVAWTLFPYVIFQTVQSSKALMRATVHVIQDLGFWESLPYTLACATAVAITYQAKVVARNLRKTYKLF